MFSGIVARVGRVVRVRNTASGTRLTIREPVICRDLRRGGSVAVEGVCLTAIGRPAAGRFEVDAVPETLARTTLGALTAGSRVNLELPLRMSDLLGGHLVSGHVDGIGAVTRISRRGKGCRLWIRPPAALARYVSYKGSVALAGVSLTVAGVSRAGFQVALIPYTLSHTTLSGLRPGSRVNLETDLLAKYLERLLGRRKRG